MGQPRTLDNKGKLTAAGLAKLGIYKGAISAGGVISAAPAGWTGGAPASSVFTVTHNLGLTADSYQVFTTVTGLTEGTASVTTRGENSFTVTTFDLSATPALADIAFQFMLVPGDGE